MQKLKDHTCTEMYKKIFGILKVIYTSSIVNSALREAYYVINRYVDINSVC